MTEQEEVKPSANTIPDWIEKSIFENLLKENIPNFQCIKKFEVNPGAAAGENYATVILRINVDVELQDGSSKSLSYMLKTGHEQDMLKDMMGSHDVFAVEKGMYDDIVPAFEKLYADVGVAVKFGPKSFVLPTDQPYVLLENLTPRGFKNVNRLEGMDQIHVECVLKKLAQWHAASAVYHEINGPFEEKYCHAYYREECKPMMKIMSEQITKIFTECAKTYKHYEEYGEHLVPQEDPIELVFRMVKVNPDEFNVLNHGDCWSNNFMFQYDAFGAIKETYVIDYQIPRYGTPAQDLYYFLVSSTNYEVKLKKFDYFIKFYHDNLSENLRLLKYTKPIPKLRDIHIMLYKYGMFGVQTAIGVMGVVLLDPTEKANLANFMGEDGDADDFKKLMFTNDRYRKHIEVLLPWFYNRGALHFS
ncbi:uncharacterized protein LOC133334990 [Musca vetustissima]|uniref:uncharacterized protein LOC133334990 n=1 Tax=Musca vetustissima TaxID=27455 RepID=UPI002AB5E485|nr:uncharacterized protein LOC133334990 [Musca vetustissima]